MSYQHHHSLRRSLRPLVLLVALMLPFFAAGCSMDASDVCQELRSIPDEPENLSPGAFDRLYDDDVAAECPDLVEGLDRGAPVNSPSRGQGDGTLSETECAALRMVALDDSKSEWDRAGAAVDYQDHCE